MIKLCRWSPSFVPESWEKEVWAQEPEHPIWTFILKKWIQMSFCLLLFSLIPPFPILLIFHHCSLMASSIPTSYYNLNHCPTSTLILWTSHMNQISNKAQFVFFLSPTRVKLYYKKKIKIILFSFIKLKFIFISINHYDVLN